VIPSTLLTQTHLESYTEVKTDSKTFNADSLYVQNNVWVIKLIGYYSWWSMYYAN